MKTEVTLKEALLLEFGVELPISGGWGDSIDRAIKIDKDYKDWADVLYTCLRLINRLSGTGWKVVKQTTIEKDGKIFDQMKLEFEGDLDFYHNYYFDITNHFHTNSLFVGGTNWPDEILTK